MVASLCGRLPCKPERRHRPDVEKLVGGRETPKQATRATDRRARKVMVDLLCQALTAPMLLRKI
jgi:hypothetical protein